MKIIDLTTHLESIAPLALQESYDNSGLICGNPEAEIKSALITLDCTEEVVDEAIAQGSGLIVAHHPIVFSGLKKINGKNYVERVIIKAIKNDIALYAAHTNMDNVATGVNARIADKIGLVNARILAPKEGLFRKLVTFCPTDQAENLRNALFSAGAGVIGNYSSCSFNSEGRGTFQANAGAEPFVGDIGKLHVEEETRVETIYPTYRERGILKVLKETHPYEEPAYDVFPLLNSFKQIGSGMIGELPEPREALGFLKELKQLMQTDCIRYTKPSTREVQRIAVCGGSGSFLLRDAIAAGADVFVTSDFKYHQFFDAENKLVIADIGHYESEQFTKQLFYDILTKKFPIFAVHLSKIDTNPINYI